jgi:hypothetical protein
MRFDISSLGKISKYSESLVVLHASRLQIELDSPQIPDPRAGSSFVSAALARLRERIYSCLQDGFGRLGRRRITETHGLLSQPFPHAE